MKRSNIFLLWTSLLIHLPSVSPQEWGLLWSDEFDDQGLNANSWTVETGFLGYNAEFQTYTDNPNNVYIQDGKLHLAAIRDFNAQVGFTSGRINTMNKVQFKYGMVEASIKIPSMKMGLWPAFWTLGQNYPQVGWPAAGELDILEAGQKVGSSQGLGNQRVVTAVHWDVNGQYLYKDAVIDMPYDLSTDFHTYKMVWQPNFIEMYVDDMLVNGYLNNQCYDALYCPAFNEFHFLVLNVAVAGLFTCCEHGFQLNDFPDGTPWAMEIDYVRIYGNEHTEIISTGTAPTSPTTAPPLGTDTTPANTAAPTFQPSQQGTIPISVGVTSAPTSITVPQEETIAPTGFAATTEQPTGVPSSNPTGTVVVVSTQLPNSMPSQEGPSTDYPYLPEAITPTMGQTENPLDILADLILDDTPDSLTSVPSLSIETEDENNTNSTLSPTDEIITEESDSWESPSHVEQGLLSSANLRETVTWVQLVALWLLIQAAL